MRRVFARLVAIFAVAITLAAPIVEGAAALPLAGLRTSTAGAAPLASKVHGFHCRPMLGWDPVAGVYRVHRHEGICRDYKGCLRKHKRCIFLLGEGFEQWSYEAFGYDTARYTACMIRAGCY